MITITVLNINKNFNESILNFFPTTQPANVESIYHVTEKEQILSSIDSYIANFLGANYKRIEEGDRIILDGSKNTYVFKWFYEDSYR